MQKRKAGQVAAGAIVAAGLAALVAFALHRDRDRILVDPTGQYWAETSHRRYSSWIPRMPGAGSDKPGFVEIFQRGKGSLGRIPVAMLQLAEVSWEPPGAVVKGIGEWDFDRHTCFYWSESQDRRIWVSGGP